MADEGWDNGLAVVMLVHGDWYPPSLDLNMNACDCLFAMWLTLRSVSALGLFLVFQFTEVPVWFFIGKSGVDGARSYAKT